MPHARHHTALDVPAAPDVLTQLAALLADVLRLKPERIDPEQTFRSLGLDSLLTVEYVATVNAHYGLRIMADALFDHPTPLAFARHVAGERGLPGPDALEQEREPRPVRSLQAKSAPQAPFVRQAPNVTVVGAGSRAATERAILDELREELARILCCDPWDIDTAESFNLLGVDSILGAEFVAVINRTYDLNERAVALYDHPSLAAMATHIASLDPVPEPEPAVMVGGPVTGIEELLDAVRDDRLSVDEALDALARPS